MKLPPLPTPVTGDDDNTPRLSAPTDLKRHDELDDAVVRKQVQSRLQLLKKLRRPSENPS